jgi:hypothetical protein
VTAGPIYERPGLRVVDDESIGHFVVSDTPIESGETIVIWAGAEITLVEALALTPKEQDYLLQVDDDCFLLAPLDELCTADFINHSCEPNCGFSNSVTLVAMRPIRAGEVLTFDYAMCDTNPFVAFDCLCRSASCRGRFTGDDWKDPALQRRYAGWFAPHVQRLIDQNQ